LSFFLVSYFSPTWFKIFVTKIYGETKLNKAAIISSPSGNVNAAKVASALPSLRQKYISYI
jgi:hypothetical protein